MSGISDCESRERETHKWQHAELSWRSTPKRCSSPYPASSSSPLFPPPCSRPLPSCESQLLRSESEVYQSWRERVEVRERHRQRAETHATATLRVDGSRRVALCHREWSSRHNKTAARPGALDSTTRCSRVARFSILDDDSIVYGSLVSDPGRSPARGPGPDKSRPVVKSLVLSRDSADECRPRQDIYRGRSSSSFALYGPSDTSTPFRLVFTIERNRLPQRLLRLWLGELPYPCGFVSSRLPCGALLRP